MSGVKKVVDVAAKAGKEFVNLRRAFDEVNHALQTKFSQPVNLDMSGQSEFCCFIRGLSDEGLREAYNKFGSVTAKVGVDKRGRSRGYGFITFEDEKAMEDAIESMNGIDLDGWFITIQKAQLRDYYRARERAREHACACAREGEARERERGGRGSNSGGGYCFKCGKPGHLARECLSGDGGRGYGFGGRDDRYGGMEDSYGGGGGNSRYGGPDRNGDRDGGRSRDGGGGRGGSGLSWSTSDKVLIEAFENFSRVTEAKVAADKFSGRSRGFGFMTIDSMNGIDLDGRSITVDKAAQPQGSGRDRDYDRGRDRDRGRDHGCGRGSNSGGGDCVKCGKPEHLARECPSH